MIYLNPENYEIKEANKTHCKKIKCYINKKLGHIKCIEKCDICESNITKIDRLNIDLKNFLINEVNLLKIINGNPYDLIEVNTEFWSILIPDFSINNWDSYLNIKKIKIEIENIEKVFNYKDWFAKKENKYYSAYDLSKSLNINTCTYCNRVYTSTITNREGIKIMRTTLDHWFPKSAYPLLALSFYNLIPSCSNCNSSIKGSESMDLNNHLHPYIDKDQTENFRFNFKYNKSLNNYMICIEDTKLGNEKAKNTLQKMFIDEIYNSHQSELRDMIKIIEIYGENYIDKIEKIFKNKISREEIYRILFGVEYNSNDFQRLPLSKFKHDILEKLKLI